MEPMSSPAHLAQLRETDPEVAGLIAAEERRERDSIRLIPSENYVSHAVLAATGSVLTNKYSEGYPGRRYYEGQQVIDPLETIAVDRAKALFGVDHANVQPYSGSPANLAVYAAFLSPGDTVMGMDLAHGGHLTHGWGVSVTGTWFHPVRYGVDRQTGRIDYDQVRADARSAATAAGYNVSGYDRDVICMGAVPGWGWAGPAAAWACAVSAWVRNFS